MTSATVRSFCGTFLKVIQYLAHGNNNMFDSGQNDLQLNVTMKQQLNYKMKLTSRTGSLARMILPG